MRRLELFWCDLRGHESAMPRHPGRGAGWRVTRRAVRDGARRRGADGHGRCWRMRCALSGAAICRRRARSPEASRFSRPGRRSASPSAIRKPPCLQLCRSTLSAQTWSGEDPCALHSKRVCFHSRMEILTSLSSGRSGKAGSSSQERGAFSPSRFRVKTASSQALRRS